MVEISEKVHIGWCDGSGTHNVARKSDAQGQIQIQCYSSIYILDSNSFFCHFEVR